MKPNELRVGNWYKSVKFGVPVHCTFSDFYELEIMADGSKVDEDIVWRMFEPIVLDYEWAEKLGFSHGYDNWMDIKFGIYWEYKSTELSVNVVSGYCYLASVEGHFSPAYLGSKINYVHQLQNLYFALTGQELTINK